MRTTTDDNDLLRQRLGHWGLAGGGLGTMALAFRLPDLLSAGLTPACDAHLAGIVLCFALWGATRGLSLSRRALRVADAGGTLAVAHSYAWMPPAYMAHHPTDNPLLPMLILQIILAYVVCARAALVPSSAKRTLIVSAACATALLPTLLTGSMPMPQRALLTVTALQWWALSTALATVTSSVIYGLRKEVKAARQFGEYHLIERIGEGGMGVVYRAQHRMLRRDTALKVLPPERAGARGVARFEREVQLTARLTHPHTVTVFDYGRTPDGLFYYTMELVDGATLEEIVQRTGPMPPARVVRILRQIAGALAEAHGLGLVHRDVKPSNIMLCESGGEPDVAKILDFGLVRDELSTGRALRETARNELLGTPLYMSPEAIMAPDQVSAASDLYALGAVAHFLLTGAPAFEATTLVEVCTQHVHSPPPRPSARADVPRALDDLVVACLAKRPAERPLGARALCELLDHVETSGWTDEEARAWWGANGPLVRRRCKDPGVPRESGTLEVDVARRDRLEDRLAS